MNKGRGWVKIAISYPPLESDKGVPLLSQNRQFQWFQKPTYIYPVVPAQAATLLKQNGFDVIWDDAIAERKTYEQWLRDIIAQKPDLIAIETKTPVIKQHWRIIDDLKGIKTVLMGDHVTAMPEESFQNSKVDYVLTGGDYDFLLLSLCKGQLEPGIYYRENGQVRNTGQFQLNHDLNQLPFIDRDLTKWQLYAYENGNYKCVPGTYTMGGRDCWWAKCRFCLTPDMKIISSEGMTTIKYLFDNMFSEKVDLNPIKVLTHNAKYKRIVKYFSHPYTGDMINLEFYNIKMFLKITPNHKIYVLRKDNMKRCTSRYCWNYICKPNRISSFLSCNSCSVQYYKNYKIELVRSDKLTVGDYVAVPIINEINNLEKIKIKDYIDEIEKETVKMINGRLIQGILTLDRECFSQRKISKLLSIDRSTVKRYIELEKNKSLDRTTISIFDNNGFLSFEGGRSRIPSEINISEGFMRLVGYYLAEGHVYELENRPNSGIIVFTFNDREIGFIDDVKNLIKANFKITPTLVVNRANKTVQITTHSTILAKFFKKLFGSNSLNKKLPEFFIYLPKEKQKELLLGLFRGDGHLRLRKYKESGTEYIYETTSPVLAQQVFGLLLRQNAIPGFREIEPRGKKSKHTKYSLTLYHADILKLFPEMNLPKRSCIYKRSFILNNYAFVPIKRITRENYSGIVYNLEVEDDHSYTANNIAVSNCSWTTTYPRFRSRKSENLLDEIGQLIDKYSIKEIMDDTGTFPAGNWLREFCKGMIERGYNKKIYLDCNMRFNAVTLEDYRLMKKANFRLLLFGIESANQYTLDRINKNLKVEQIIESCKLARQAGLFPHITIMFGYPWETYEDACRTLKLGRWLLKKGYAYTVQATVVIPYPGTPLFNECGENNWLKTLDWERYDMKEPVMKTPMPDSQVMKFVQGIYSVAFNPEFIWRRITTATTASDIKYFLRGAKKVVGHIFDFGGGHYARDTSCDCR